MHVRRYEAADHEEVLALHRRAMKDVGAFLPGPWDQDLDAISAIYMDYHGEFLVGEVAGTLVAMGALRRVNATTGEIKRIRVSPAQQRRGFGQAILSHLEVRAASLGYRLLELDTLENQTGAIRFFLKNGYSQVGTRQFEGHVQLLFRKSLASGA